MARGDHIYIQSSGPYTHHGIDCGDGFVIHRSSDDGTKVGARIRKTTVEEFSGGAVVRVKIYGQRLSPDDAVARAESMLEEPGYNLVCHNCEHFASWCVTDDYASEQVDTAVSAGRVVGLGIGVPAVSMRAVSAVGSGARLSGPNLMSGLARIGGNATAGLVVAGVIAGAATTCGMCSVMRDKPYLTENERVSRRNGRYAAAAGAAGGVVVSYHLVGAVGIAGYSAAGITSGLATLGATVGGGMAAGATVVIGLPAVLAAMLGYLFYRLTRWWLDRQSAEGTAPRPVQDFGGLSAA